MSEEEIKAMNLSSWEFIGWIRVWWHSLWRTLSEKDHRMNAFTKISNPSPGTDSLPNVRPGTNVAVTCMCGKLFWLHPDVIADLCKDRSRL